MTTSNSGTTSSRPGETLDSRISILRKQLVTKALSDRSGEWIQKKHLPDVTLGNEKKPVIIRRAIAIDEMLKTLCKPECSYAHCFEFGDQELLAGTIPMGSNGLGKVFANYLTVEEKRVGSVTNKTELALLGHNTIDYSRIVDKGLQWIIDYAHKHDKQDNSQESHFYQAVEISCQAVINHSLRWAALADAEAKLKVGTAREAELKEIARICRKVPAQKADTIAEAMQAIWMVHCCLHATMDYMSLGRLDQVLNKFLNTPQDLATGELLFQNLILKAAGRINLSTQYLVQQDHMDYNAALGIHSYYLDQRAGINNFLQNIIIGGKKPDGSDACNPATFMILNAFRKVNISTPGIYVRLHDHSPKELRDAVATCLSETKNIPYILNDEVMIPALKRAMGISSRTPSDADRISHVVNDYCVDGCWEPILNGISEWTFGMVNGMTMLECALNRGALLSSNPELLRGQKIGPDTGEIRSFANLESALKKQIGFAVDQSVLSMCLYYMTTEYVVPTPLVSALFGTCLERGKDKSWGGAQYNIGGTILGGAPDMVNTLAAIKLWVFDKKKYSLSDVLEAMRASFCCNDPTNVAQRNLFDSIKVDFFTNSPQLGNDQDADPICHSILDYFVEAVNKAKKLTEKVFFNKDGDNDPSIKAMRAIAGYYGPSLQSIIPGFELTFTAGMGTFEQYNWQGAGIAGSAGRNAGDPLAPNFTPASGSWHKPAVHFFNSLKSMDMERFAAGVITDVCLQNSDSLSLQISSFIKNRGSMLTMTIADPRFQEIYEIAKTANQIDNKKSASDLLEQYSNIMVRVGGWNAPFITLPLVHMEDYINRANAAANVK